MKIIKPSVQIITPLDGEAILKHIELCGRVCYKSEDKITSDSARQFVQKIIHSGHESVLEHYSFTVRFICDRGVSHEIVRHRIASFSLESSRYCDYSKGKFDNEITVIELSFFERADSDDWTEWDEWHDACGHAEASYFNLLRHGASPQEARTVLPNSLKTELIMTANLREWRHFLKLRCSKAAHPQMRELALDLLRQVHEAIPVVFDDIWENSSNA